jgi:hypothetical protein
VSSALGKLVRLAAAGHGTFMTVAVEIGRLEERQRQLLGEGNALKAQHRAFDPKTTCSGLKRRWLTGADLLRSHRDQGTARQLKRRLSKWIMRLAPSARIEITRAESRPR